MIESNTTFKVPQSPVLNETILFLQERKYKEARNSINKTLTLNPNLENGFETLVICETLFHGKEFEVTANGIDWYAVVHLNSTATESQVVTRCDNIIDLLSSSKCTNLPGRIVAMNLVATAKSVLSSKYSRGLLDLERESNGVIDSKVINIDSLVFKQAYLDWESPVSRPVKKSRMDSLPSSGSGSDGGNGIGSGSGLNMKPITDSSSVDVNIHDSGSGLNRQPSTDSSSIDVNVHGSGSELNKIPVTNSSCINVSLTNGGIEQPIVHGRGTVFPVVSDHRGGGEQPVIPSVFSHGRGAILPVNSHRSVLEQFMAPVGYGRGYDGEALPVYGLANGMIQFGAPYMYGHSSIMNQFPTPVTFVHGSGIRQAPVSPVLSHAIGGEQSIAPQIYGPDSGLEQSVSCVEESPESLKKRIFDEMPQTPHYKPLDKFSGKVREGMIQGLEMAFVNLSEEIRCLGDPKGLYSGWKGLNGQLTQFEEMGYNVVILKDRLNKLRGIAKSDEPNQVAMEEFKLDIANEEVKMSHIGSLIQELESDVDRSQMMINNKKCKLEELKKDSKKVVDVFKSLAKSDWK